MYRVEHPRCEQCNSRHKVAFEDAGLSAVKFKCPETENYVQFQLTGRKPTVAYNLLESPPDDAILGEEGD